MRFDLGDKVRDPISEVEGRVSQLIRHLYSQDRVCIQPPYNKVKGFMPATVTIDDTHLEIVEPTELATIHKYKDSTEFNLGDVVTDTLNKMDGTISERSLSTNGCYAVKLAVKNKDGEPRTLYSQEKGITLKTPVAETTTKPENRSTGMAMEIGSHE